MEKIDMHKLLVNGIIGAPLRLEEDLFKEYVGRGFVHSCGFGGIEWNRDALDAQPNHVLVGVYERVTA